MATSSQINRIAASTSINVPGGKMQLNSSLNINSGKLQIGGTAQLGGVGVSVGPGGITGSAKFGGVGINVGSGGISGSAKFGGIGISGSEKFGGSKNFGGGGGADGTGAGSVWNGYTSDPAANRLSSNNLISGGGKPPVPATKVTSSSTTNNDPSDDWRVRISVAQGVLYTGNDVGVLAPLQNTDGVIFPYTPNISVSHAATYNPQKFTHSNYTALAYENSEIQAITIVGDFTVQNVEEGQYLLACLYFFRAATKMFFGGQGQDKNAGNPPPMVFLDGYGSHYFPHVPCVITTFTHTLLPDVDYIGIPIDYSITRLPVTSSISLTLQPIYSKKIISKNFNLNDFAAGRLINKGGFI